MLAFALPRFGTAFLHGTGHNREDRGEEGPSVVGFRQRFSQNTFWPSYNMGQEVANPLFRNNLPEDGKWTKPCSKGCQYWRP
jgi:hypothetical protein